MSEQALTVVAAPKEQSLSIAILEALRDPTLDPARLREFLAAAKDAEEMQLRRDARAAEQQYNAAWAALMPELPTIDKNGLIEYKPGTKGTSFAKWDDIHKVCMPFLYKHGFAVSGDSITDGNKLTILVVITHVGGHKEVRHFAVAAQDTGGSKSPAQASASAYTIGFRHAFCKAFNILTKDQDDDGTGRGIPALISDADVMTLVDLLEAAEHKIPGTNARFMAHIRQSYGVDALSALTAEQAKIVRAGINKKLEGK